MSSPGGIPVKMIPSNGINDSTVKDPTISSVTGSEAICGVCKETTCYDLMQASSKGTVFETTIPFQLAFFALIEHDCDVAPLWDPTLRSFVGLMTVVDYITALRVCMIRNISPLQLTEKTIGDMRTAALHIFSNDGFQTVDADDSVVSLIRLLETSNNSYVPVVDSETSNLVSILSKLDIIHLFDQIAHTNQALFSEPIATLSLGTTENLYTVTKDSLIHEILTNLERRNISAVPVVDENGVVIGIYHRSDVSFVIKASDPDMFIKNLTTFTVGEVLTLREQILASGDVMSPHQSLVKVHRTDNIAKVLRDMVYARTLRAVVVDEAGRCVSIIAYSDLVKFYLADQLEE